MVNLLEQFMKSRSDLLMKKFIFYFFLSVHLFSEQVIAEAAPSLKTSKEIPVNNDEEFILFTPPTGWSGVDPSCLPKSVIAMVVDDSIHPYRPSIILSTELYKKTLKDYLKLIKSKEEAKGNLWKELDTVKTQAGLASLSQVDETTEWGVIRHMYLILLKNQQIYILSAAATTDVFSKYYKTFFKSMRSLRVCEDLLEIVPSQSRKMQLQSAYKKVKDQWNIQLSKKKEETPDATLQQIKKEVFDSDEFKNLSWNPFQEMLNKQYADLGSVWQNLYLKKSQNDL